jgi:hypothetical protein
LPQEAQINIANLEQALPRNLQSGMMTVERAHSFYPDIKQQVNDNDDMYADKKMLGGLYSDKRHPYEHIATRNNGSYMVGGYGATFNSFSHYASLGLTPEVLEKLGHPPNWSKLGDVVKNLKDTDPQAYDDYVKNVTAAQQAGKIDADLAKRLLPGADGKFDDISHFGRFVAKLQGHRGHITTAELRQNMSSTTQEAMATALIKEYKGMGADASKIALAVGLDKAPDELTAADLSGAKARSLRYSSRKFYHLARASQHAGKDDAIAIHETGQPGSMSYKLAKAFMKHASSTSPGGWCAGHLADALAAVGLGKWRNDATPMAKSMLASGEWVAINPDKAAPGDVCYRPHASGHGGHIEGVVAITSRGVELASDFHHTLANIRDNNNGYYSGLTVMRYVGKNGAKDLSKTENA